MVDWEIWHFAHSLQRVFRRIDTAMPGICMWPINCLFRLHCWNWWENRNDQEITALYLPLYPLIVQLRLPRKYIPLSLTSRVLVFIACNRTQSSPALYTTNPIFDVKHTGTWNGAKRSWKLRRIFFDIGKRSNMVFIQRRIVQDRCSFTRHGEQRHWRSPGLRKIHSSYLLKDLDLINLFT